MFNSLNKPSDSPIKFVKDKLELFELSIKELQELIDKNLEKIEKIQEYFTSINFA